MPSSTFAARAAAGEGNGGRPRHNAAMGGHNLYLVGGAPRVGKSSLAKRLLEIDGIPLAANRCTQDRAASGPSTA